MCLTLCNSYKNILNLNESLQPKMVLTSLTAVSSAFVLLEDQLCSCTENMWAQFIRSVFSALYKHVESDLYLLTWE